MSTRPDPWWDFPRDTAAVRMFVETAADHGVSAAHCLDGSGLTEQSLVAPGTTVRAEQELQVGRNLLAAVGDTPGIGIQVGLKYSLARAGILGFAIISSQTFRDAAAIALRYFGLSSAFNRPSFGEDQDHGWFALDGTDLPEDVRAMMVERDLAAITQLLPFVAGGLDLDGIHLDVWLEPERARFIGDLLPGISVQASDRTAVVFPRALLDLPLPAANPAAAELSAKQCAALLNQRQELRGVSAQVRQVLLQNPTAMPEIPEVAAELLLDIRTLQRRLSEEGTTFRDLVGDTRKALAIELLSGLTVSEVARRLGYSEVAAFSRAFKRWTGRTPQDYRRGDS